MSLNETVSAERVHIGFFGQRNAGKSSLVNAVTGQTLSLVSDIKGTTTDPVKKAMELAPIGPVVIIDTPGMDDEGELGQMRVERARQVLRHTDVAVLVVDASNASDASKSLQPADSHLIELFRQRGVPYLIAYNKCDLLPEGSYADKPYADKPYNDEEGDSIYVSAEKGIGIKELKDQIGKIISKKCSKERRLVGDLLVPGDLVILVTPIDESAPKGRIILPQQQVLRDVLDSGCTAMVCRETELENTLNMISPERKVRMVITDSQVFGYVSKIVPPEIPLTSFSILMARYKGILESAVHGAAQLSKLKPGDKVLISEGCTHHRQCNDIGTVKLPAWICNYTGLKTCKDDEAGEANEIEFSFTSGGEFPEDLSPYKLVVHCGGCMLNDKEMEYRRKHAEESGVAITNYGIAIAQMHGILRRSVELFPHIAEML